MPRKLTKREFIFKARKVHGKKYLYPRIDYKNAREKIKIWCRKCKVFFDQVPDSHLRGCGCPTCAKGFLSSTKKEFIKKARKIHGLKQS